MKILHWDAETGPNLAWVWGLWKQNVSLSQIEETGELLCWAALWDDQSRVAFNGLNKSTKSDMIAHLHSLLDEADVVVHYNGKQFDTKWANRCFLEEGLHPPSPYKEVDLLQVVRRKFKFPSYKLQYVADRLGLGSKEPHEGFELWLKCMRGDDRAWRKMRKYNIQDVKLLKALYHKLLPWIDQHPNRALYESVAPMSCPTCASSNVERRGYYRTAASKFARYQCKDCGKWGRSPVSETKPASRKEMLRNAN